MAVIGYISLTQRALFRASPGDDVGEIAIFQGRNPQKGWAPPSIRAVGDVATCIEHLGLVSRGRCHAIDQPLLAIAGCCHQGHTGNAVGKLNSTRWQGLNRAVVKLQAGLGHHDQG